MEIKISELRGDATKTEEVVKLLTSQRKDFTVTYEDAEKQYDPKKHKVFDLVQRPNKLIRQYRGNDSDGNPIYETVQSPVARMAIPYQKLIVERIVGIMLGNEIKLTEENYGSGEKKNTDLYKAVKRIWKDAKLDFKNREILRALLSEMEVAEIWYAYKGSDGEVKVRSRIASPSRGDKLYPFFDADGSLVAFSRQYTLKSGEVEEARMDTYMKEGTLKFVQVDGKYQLEAIVSNSLGKLPVVYYCQDAPEWYDVQEFCDRQDTLTSNFSDTNDYFGSPMVKVTGSVEGFADKGEQGKVITVNEGGDVDYLTWDSAPEAIKTEFDNNEDVIFGSMQIPNFSWSKIKNIGNLQNAILKLFFTDPHMKAETKWEVFGIGIQRRLNILSSVSKNILGATDGEGILIEPEMKPYVPENLAEIVGSLVTATGGEPIMSQQRGVELNPMVEDSENEVKRLDEEVTKRNAESFALTGE